MQINAHIILPFVKYSQQSCFLISNFVPPKQLNRYAKQGTDIKLESGRSLS